MYLFQIVLWPRRKSKVDIHPFITMDEPRNGSLSSDPASRIPRGLSQEEKDFLDAYLEIAYEIFTRLEREGEGDSHKNI
jgi:hypothetical protein